jgi:hypothetical protein
LDRKLGDAKDLEIIWLPTPPGNPHEIAVISYFKDGQRTTLILKISGDDVLALFGY